ncbi:chromobox protein homolog 8-like isoform X2 [Lineus longissimus]|uniref:chromobox protein homolog 8-like isoform X2 n=1 Tax=Lineus longissimus TaxID=88925 RepID=UPI00315D6916
MELSDGKVEYFVKWKGWSSNLIGQILQKIRVDRAMVLLVFPVWNTQPWFPTLLQMAIDIPRILPRRSLYLPRNTQLSHPLEPKLCLAVVRLSGKPSLSEDFRKTLPRYNTWEPESNILDERLLEAFKTSQLVQGYTGAKRGPKPKRPRLEISPKIRSDKGTELELSETVNEEVDVVGSGDDSLPLNVGEYDSLQIDSEGDSSTTNVGDKDENSGLTVCDLEQRETMEEAYRLVVPKPPPPPPPPAMRTLKLQQQRGQHAPRRGRPPKIKNKLKLGNGLRNIVLNRQTSVIKSTGLVQKTFEERDLGEDPLVIDEGPELVKLVKSKQHPRHDGNFNGIDHREEPPSHTMNKSLEDSAAVQFLEKQGLKLSSVKSCAMFESDSESDDGRIFWQPPADSVNLWNKVFVTDVTANMITVTFRESTTDKGFFRSRDSKDCNDSEMSV